MAKKEQYESMTEQLLEPIMKELDFELYDVEYVKEGSDYYLRVYIDKEGGVNIDDCVNVSRKLEVLLDEKDIISEAYILEVSSPGLGRQLKKEKHFIKSIGREVDIRLYKPEDGVKEFTGKLDAYENGRFVISTDTKKIELASDRISKICLHENW